MRMTLPAVAVVLLLASAPLAQDGEAPEQRAPGGKGATMDYGSFLSSTVSRVKYRTDEDLLSHKGISIRVGPQAAMCFDSDLLRWAGGWTGGFLDLSNTHLVSYKGSLPTTLEGTLRFTTSRGPGWAVGDDFADPRPYPYGPLPEERGRYLGLYRHGERVVLSYVVAGCSILELPGFTGEAFTRTIRLGPSRETLSLRAAEGQVPVGLVGAPEGAAVVTAGGEVRVRIPPRSSSSLFTVVIGGSKAGLPEDPAPLCSGGPSRWGEPQVTRGALGAGPGPYVVDTLVLPEANPWKSWLRLTGLDFFSDGRAAFCTWNGDVWTVEGIDEKLERLTFRRFAAGLYEPLGLKIVGDQVYVLGRDRITRLRDLDGDGEADFYENFHDALTTMANYHAFVFELHTDSRGNFYYAVDGHRVDPSVPLHGCIVKVSPDGRRHEVVATGLRAPNGLSVGPGDEITCSDQEGHWVPTSRLNWVRRGGFYGYVPHSGRKDPPASYDPPLCWIPHGVDNSSGGQVWVTSDRWGPLSGALLHTSYGKASLFLVPFERAGDVVQGGVARFPLAFASGVMRGRFHPKDGQLYLAGLRGWQTTGLRDGCLQRVRYTGQPVHMVTGLKVTRDGLELTFPHPLDPETAASADSWAAQMWNYRWSEKYGSPEFSVSDPARQGRDPVEIRAARLSSDGRTVSLAIPGIRPVMQMLVRGRVRAADGAAVPVELYLTINRVP
jgi:hypothetical protein